MTGSQGAPLGRRVALLMLFAALCLSCLTVGALAQDTTQVRATEKGILVDFQDTDIRVVITALAEAGGLNVTYGDLPARRITLRMRQPVARENILPLLRSLVRSNGLRVREEGGILRIEAAGPGEPSETDSLGSGAQQGEARLFVYRLRHAQATKLAATLQAVFGAGPSAQTRPPALRRPLSDQLRDQRLRPFTPDSVARPRPDSAGLTSPSLPGQLRGEIQIVPDEATNSLLVRAQPDDWAIIEQAVQAMDLRPLQVLIEVLIAEVRRSRGLEVGITGSASRTKRGETTPSSIAELKGLSTADFILKLRRGGTINVDIALSALATRGEVRILSRPLIIAQNNQEAKILVGSQRPFVQVFRSLPTDAGVRDQIVQYRDVGTSLTILPTINPDGYVNLHVVQEVSTATDETQFGAPIISTREATTQLFVRDSQTAVIGGLIDRQTDKTRSGIPILSAIPGLGRLFGGTRETTSTSELFLFLTPHLVRTDEDLDALRRWLEAVSKEVPRPSDAARPRPPDSDRR